MNALIFAAGMGTRLSHITKNTPKALVKVAGKPMLQHAIEKLVEARVSRIVINVHHFADKIIHFVSTLSYPETEILISDERDELLETGGGLLKASPMFIPGQPIILYNADVITGVNLNSMIQYHHDKGGIATLMVKKRETSRYFIFDDNMLLCGWKNITTKDQIITRNTDVQNTYAFSGIHIINPEIATKLGSVRKFSITNGYLDISNKNEIYGWKDWDEYWFDIGTPEKLMTAENFLTQ